MRELLGEGKPDAARPLAPVQDWPMLESKVRDPAKVAKDEIDLLAAYEVLAACIVVTISSILI